MRALARIANLVTIEPWSLAKTDIGPLTDEDIHHVVALSAFFGHLNRIADAVAVPLDYVVELEPPPPDPLTPALLAAPRMMIMGGTLARPATAAAIAAWRDYVFDRDAPLARPHREAIAGVVATWLGDGSGAPLAIDPALRQLAETITLAPWQLTDASFTQLRTQGYDDAMLFDACVTASTAGMTSRIAVALGALAG